MKFEIPRTLGMTALFFLLWLRQVKDSANALRGAAYSVAAIALVFVMPTAQAAGPLVLKPDDRILVLAPHPDDEVLGCGAVIQAALKMKLPVWVVWLTYGDNNEWSFIMYRKLPILLPSAVRRMGLLRRSESVAAAAKLGLNENQLTFLGYPDFRMMKIWHTRWGTRPAIRSMLTRARAVPYENAYRTGAPYKGEEVLNDLTAVIAQFKPTKIFTAHAADDNGDHRALYAFTRVALWQLDKEVNAELLPYLVHFGRWPQPRGENATRSLQPPQALADELHWKTFPVPPEMIGPKRDALQLHRSQYRYSRKYMLSFLRTNELFGDFRDLTLPREGAAQLEDRPTDTAEEIPEELTESEQSAFIGMHRGFIERRGDQLILSVQLTQPLTAEVEASIYVFGYDAQRPFGEMPKIHIKVGDSAWAVFDANRKLDRGSVVLRRSRAGLRVVVPLSLLGNPQRVLTCAQTYTGEVPLDWLAWRVIELPGR